MKKRKKGWKLIDLSNTNSGEEEKKNELLKQQKEKEEAEFRLKKERDELKNKEEKKSEELTKQQKESHGLLFKLKKKQEKESRNKRNEEEKKRREILKQRKEKQEAEFKLKKEQEKLKREEEEELRNKRSEEENKRKELLKQRKEKEEKIEFENNEQKRKEKLNKKSAQNEKERSAKELKGRADPKNAKKKPKLDAKPSSNIKENKKEWNYRYLFVIILLILSLLAYLVSCKIFGYCLITPISDSEVVVINEVQDPPEEEEGSSAKEEESITKTEKPVVWYSDEDGDGFRNPTIFVEAVNQPNKFISGNNPIDNCPSGAGPKCTQGCPDKNGNCIPDKDEDKSKETDVTVVITGVDTGTTIKPTLIWFRDEDGDGKGDINISKNFSFGIQPEGWAIDKTDKCPKRYGKDDNGCPLAEIKSIDVLLLGEQETFTADIEGSWANDKFLWSSSNLQITNPNSKETEIFGNRIGKYRFDVTIKNETDYIDIT